MPFNISDNLLLVATCVGLYISYYAINNTLRSVKESIIAPDEVPLTTAPTQTPPNAEDQIDVPTLRTLTKSYNLEVRNAAIKIVISRAIQPGYYQALLCDLRSPNYDNRDNAINALWLILYGVDNSDKNGNANRMQALQSFDVYYSIITALIAVNPEHKTTLKGKASGRWALEVPPSPIKPITRPAHETSLMIMLQNLISSDSLTTDPSGQNALPITLALRAGLVTDWLAHYPFPCTLPAYSSYNFKKGDICMLFADDRYTRDDPLMARIFALVSKEGLGMRHLRQAGLMNRHFREKFRPVALRRRRSYEVGIEDDGMDVMMTNGEDTAGYRPGEVDLATGRAVRRNIRPGSGSQERLRRRRREAIVVAEQGEELTRGNILQRGDSIDEVLLRGWNGGGNGMVEVEVASQVSSGVSGEESIPELDEVEEPVDRSLNESPQSFRRRIDARLRQGFRSFPADGQVRPAGSRNDPAGEGEPSGWDEPD